MWRPFKRVFFTGIPLINDVITCMLSDRLTLYKKQSCFGVIKGILSPRKCFSFLEKGRDDFVYTLLLILTFTQNVR